MADALSPELSQEAIRLIASYGVARTYPKHAVVVSEGDLSDHFYVLLQGRVKVYVSDDHGKEALLNTLGSGDYFGELAILDAAQRSASVMTLEPCRMAVVDRQRFEQCLAEQPGFALELIRNLVRRVRGLTDQVKGLALQDVYGRIAQTLLSLARPRDDLQVIDERLTHQEIANRVGASREMVSRIMKDLNTGGYIGVEDQRIVIRKTLPASW